MVEQTESQGEFLLWGHTTIVCEPLNLLLTHIYSNFLFYIKQLTLKYILFVLFI